MDSLEHHLSWLERCAMVLTSLAPALAVPMGFSLPDAQHLKTLEDKVQKFIQNAPRDTSLIGGFSFPSQHDTKVWAMGKIPKGALGCIWDVHFLLEKVAGKISGSDTRHVRATDWEEAQHRLQKAQFGSKDAAIILSSFPQEGPAVFYDGAGHEILPGFPTKWKGWDPVSSASGLCTKFGMAINN